MILDIIVRNCKIVFPVLVIFVAAITVVIALNANRAEAQTPADGQSEEHSSGQEQSSENGSPEDQVVENAPSAAEVPLIANEDAAVYSLVSAYYEAIRSGDTAALQTMCHGISENNLLYYAEMSNYIDHYSGIEIYSKQGPANGAIIVYVYYKMGLIDYGESPAYETLYVCTDEQGELYIKDANIFTEDEKEYILTANAQVDVVEFNNRVNVEYNELLVENPELLEYIGVLKSQLVKRVGEILASRTLEEEQPEAGEEGQEEGTGEPEQPAGTDPAVEAGPKYATATTTVNVRNSDSEKAEKLGKVSRGTRLEVQEVRVNGWTKVLYEGKDGYIKSEYLQLEENVAEQEVIGTVTATTNLNVRAAASEDADRLGLLSGGSSLELFAVENGWCKVNYNGQVGYVKADYVTQQ